jgi:GT2 family glycosyltransferase
MFAVKSNPYRITLIDDGSPNAAFGEKLNKGADQDMIRCIRSDTQKGFGGAVRLGYENTSQPWVMVMHSDVRIEEPNWMLRMGESLLKFKETDPAVKLVSAKTNNPGSGHDSRLKSNKPVSGTADREPDFVLKEGFVPMYCVMFHRQLFNYVGGPIKEYPFGSYEDEEFGWRMKAYGFKQAICGSAWVHHESGATINEVCKTNPAAKEQMEKNYERCVADIRLHPKKKQAGDNTYR